MPVDTLLERELLQYVDAHRGDLIQLLQRLVRIPSENTPPVGAEGACQAFCAGSLSQWGFNVDLYAIDAVEGLSIHPLYWPGRDYSGRPNLAARRKGSGGGRSLILSGHIDTVPRGTLPWTMDPFSGHIEDGRLYGRGANDMKAGIAMSLMVGRAIHELGLPLRGDLTVESVVDEEFGGVNGTLAGRLRGYLADAAVITEPSFLRVCPAQRGGLTAHILLEVPNAGILSGTMESGVEAQLAWLLSQVPIFAKRRRLSAPAHPAYAHLANAVPVTVQKIHTGPWGTGEPMATASSCRIELSWQSMPGEKLNAVKDEFLRWIDETVSARGDLFPHPPRVEFPIRWLPGSSINLDDPLVEEVAGAAAEVLGSRPAVAGIEGPCDMFVFQHEFGIPAVLWGPRGGNTHLADEYVEIDSLVAAAKALLLFVYRWCNREPA